jgi:hypothetical protein
MASSDENAETINPHQQRNSNAGLAGGELAAGNGQVRRRRSKEAHQEVVDELAQETKRVTLLEREEQQLKGRKHVSRLLFIFGIVDDRKTQTAVEQEFVTWRDAQEGGDQVTGLLLFLGQAAVSFLEGPTELLFKALEHFHELTLEVQAAPVMPLPPADMRSGGTMKLSESTAPPPAPRAALISPVRVLYFTELHGVRTSVGWCSCVSNAKTTQAQVNFDEGAHEPVFDMYKKMLILSMKVQSGAGSDSNPSADSLRSNYRKNGDFMPTPDEVHGLLGKQGAENFFSFAEFQKVFMKPFQLVLNSELLWPMPPALSY